MLSNRDKHNLFPSHWFGCKLRVLSSDLFSFLVPSRLENNFAKMNYERRWIQRKSDVIFRLF